MDSSNVRVSKSSYIYNILNNLRITESTETKIKDMMKYSIPYSYTKIFNNPFNGKVYYKSYIYLPVNDLIKVELWFEGKYIHSHECTIIGHVGALSVILLDKRYDDTLNVRYWVNPNVFNKLGNISSSGNVEVSYNTIAKVDGITEKSFYAIYDNKFITPISVEDLGSSYLVKFAYTNSLEIFVCRNLEYSGSVDQYETVQVSDIDYPIICGRYILNTLNSPLLDVRFYPYIRSLEPGFLRVFSDISAKVNPIYLPYIRFMRYPENIIISDPYDSLLWDNHDMIFSSETINQNDTTEVIFDKLEDLSKEYYRAYDLIHSMNKLIECLDNAFTTKEMTIEGYIHRIHVSKYPYSKTRDILHYNGLVFSNYQTACIRDIDTSYCEIDQVRGFDRLYILDDDNLYNVRDFSILKLNSDNNSTIKNIAYYIQANTNGEYDYLINFDKCIQTLYRNLLVVKDYDFDFYDSNEVVLAETESDLYPEIALLEVDSVEGDDPVNPIETFDANTLTDLHLNDPALLESDMSVGEVFAEWVDTTGYAKNLYRDDEIFICELNGSIIKIELSKDNVEDILDIFIFEDIMLNFRAGSKVLPYNGILPDLLNSKLINESDLLIFDGILHDSRKREYIKLENYPYPYNTITNNTYQVNPDMSIIYSKNIKRYSLYREDMSEFQANELNAKIINLTQFPIYFDKDEFIVFANGRYIKRSDISVIGHNRFIVNFIDDIYRVDVLYSILDEDVFRLKNILSK